MKFPPGRNFARSGGNVQRHMGVIVSIMVRSRWLRLAKMSGQLPHALGKEKPADENASDGRS
jgi:hypothetical protein